MGFLEKWKPSTELDRFRREFDDLLERLSSDRDWFAPFRFERPFFGEREAAAARPAIESSVENGKFIVRTDLPGIDPKNVDIKVVGNVLTIKGTQGRKARDHEGRLLQARNPIRLIRTFDLATRGDQGGGSEGYLSGRRA